MQIPGQMEITFFGAVALRHKNSCQTRFFSNIKRDVLQTLSPKRTYSPLAHTTPKENAATVHQHMCSFWLTFFALQEKDGILLKVRTFNLDCCLHLDAFPV